MKISTDTISSVLCILPHGLERASAALHHNHEGTFRLYKAACTTVGSFNLVGSIPSIIAFDVRLYQYVNEHS